MSFAWYSWKSLSDFNLWHSQVCVGLGIPHPNRNNATGEIDPDAQWTTDYTVPVEIEPTDWRAMVGDDIATLYFNRLGTPSDPPPPVLF